MFVARPASVEDLKAITDIYNEAVLTTDATFDLEPKTEEEQGVWLARHDRMHPVLVAELDGVVIGWHPSASGRHAVLIPPPPKYLFT